MLASELRLMAVLAHPDDESLGTGGALAKIRRRGSGDLSGDGDER
jgi:LmbE family N-acetylglucosaminyl deacetylase